MKKTDLKKLRKEMEKELNSKRYEHTLAVAYTAASLAMVHGADTESAAVAGMLHDCAKCLSNKKLISICTKNGLPVSEVEMQNPAALLHAKAGSFLAENKYGIRDEDILNAIRYHTTGRPGMSRLEKILYIADYIEPGRKHAANLGQIRKMAFQNLDKTLFKILEDTLSYLQSMAGHMDAAAQKTGPLDPMTKETYEYYKKSVNSSSC
ncbi:MAG: bis(5'-nucleosyl)-tetraphosphatase (symmetrical) YqeK [Blautia sp.]|nr:bis(5'-nucleosyl)-tetraphosphatase (symmetrical) YqeK [Blautia sp.]MCM1200543.1 bis(5'-nucleosyl)-tetraphosphatase (symmetrical) YqeK [Bacteroides fragilis]